MSPCSLVVRAAAGPGVGFGHLGRCLALAQAWRATGGDVTLVASQVPEPWARRWADEGATVAPPERAATLAADAVVLDGYDLPHEDVTALARRAPALCIADHGQGSGLAPAAIVLDQNLGADRSDYPLAVPTTQLLLGPRYALLRRDVIAAARERGPDRTPARAARLLVALGGDPTPELQRLVDAVAAAPSVRELVRVDLAGLRDTGPAMAAADLAIATAGSTTWELAATGVPMVLLAIAPNQVPLAQRMARAGAAIDATALEGPEAIAAALAGLAASPDERRAQIAAGRALVDGHGARRVVTALRGRTLRLRPVEADDERRLWEWANDPDVRAASFDSAPIPWEDHRRWFAAATRDRRTRIYIAADGDGSVVGQMRVECRDGRGFIDLSIAPERRGEALAAPVISAGATRAFADLPAGTLDQLVGEVKVDNERSARAFLAADFDPQEPASTGATRSRTYTRPRYE